MSGKLFTSAVMKAICVWVLASLPAVSSNAQQAPEMGAIVPLPDPNPLRVPPLTLEKNITPPHPNSVETPDWSDDEIAGALSQCDMMLAGTGAVYKPLDPIREGRCGAPAPVELSSIGTLTPVEIHPPAKVSCGLAATLSAWMDFIVQPAASQHLGTQIMQIRNVASYVCRNRYGSSKKPLSEHGLANALDMAAFQTQSGQWITVLDDWALPLEEQAAQQEPVSENANSSASPPIKTTDDKNLEVGNAINHAVIAIPLAEEPQRKELSPEAVFLNEIHSGGCTLFGTVLGPKANEAHKNHYHYDMAARSNGNYCE